MIAAAAIAAGGVGAAGRYWVSGLVHRAARRHFPLGTMVVNLVGSLAAGVALAVTPEGSISRAALGGLAAGFTTLSTWSAESLAMLHDGRWLRAALNLGGMLAAGICLAAAGYHLAH